MSTFSTNIYLDSACHVRILNHDRKKGEKVFAKVLNGITMRWERQKIGSLETHSNKPILGKFVWTGERGLVSLSKNEEKSTLLWIVIKIKLKNDPGSDFLLLSLSHTLKLIHFIGWHLSADNCHIYISSPDSPPRLQTHSQSPSLCGCFTGISKRVFELYPLSTTCSSPSLCYVNNPPIHPTGFCFCFFLN